MSIYPRIEARVSALERRQTQTDARFEEVTEDMTTGFKQLSDQMLASFKQASDYDTEIEKLIDTRFNKIETDIAEIKTTMLAMENRMLDAFKQLLTAVNYPGAKDSGASSEA